MLFPVPWDWDWKRKDVILEYDPEGNSWAERGVDDQGCVYRGPTGMGPVYKLWFYKRV